MEVQRMSENAIDTDTSEVEIKATGRAVNNIKKLLHKKRKLTVLPETNTVNRNLDRNIEEIILSSDSDVEIQEQVDQLNENTSIISNPSRSTNTRSRQSCEICMISSATEDECIIVERDKQQFQKPRKSKTKRYKLEISRTKQVLDGKYKRKGPFAYKHPLLLTFGVSGKDLDKAGIKHQKGHWTEHELQMLKDNIEDYSRENNIKSFNKFFQNNKEIRNNKDDGVNMYVTLANGIYRPISLIKDKISEHVCAKSGERKSKYERFSDDENKMLLNLYRKYPNEWTKIAFLMDRNTTSVRNCYKKIIEKSQCKSEKRFKLEEDKKIIDFVSNQQTKKHNINWKALGKILSRRPNACKDRWYRILSNESHLKKPKKKGRTVENYDKYMKIAKALIEAEVTSSYDIDWDNLFEKIGIPKSVKLIANFKSFYFTYANKLKGKTYCDKLKSFINVLKNNKSKRT